MTTYTTSWRIAQPITADPAVRNQWGTIWDNAVAVIEQGGTGNTPINIAALTTYTLTTANNAPDQARQMVWPFTGALTATCTITIPAVPKISLAMNNTTGGQTIVLTTGVSGGRTVALPPGLSTWVTCDGTNVDAPIMAGALPIGAIQAFAGSTAPPRWLMCYGQAVSRTTYALLFAVIGTTYGGSGTTFNLPDLRGRGVSGLDNMGGTAAGRVTSGSGMPGTTLGGAGGSELLQYHTHTVSDPGHVHGINDPGHAHSVSDPSHVHGMNDPGHTHAVSDPGHVHSFTVTTLQTPGGAAYGSGFNISGQTASTGTGYTGISVQGSPAYVSTQYSGTGIGIYGNYTSISLQYSGTSISIGGSGGGSSQNMPPTMMVNYMIYAGA